MKVRRDFVTNSSSASYIIYLDEKISFNEFKDKFPDPFRDYLEYLKENFDTEEEYEEEFSRCIDLIVEKQYIHQVDDYNAYFLASLVGEIMEQMYADSEEGFIFNTGSRESMNKILNRISKKKHWLEKFNKETEDEIQT